MSRIQRFLLVTSMFWAVFSLNSRASILQHWWLFRGETNYRDLAVRIAEKHGIEPALFLGLIAQESNFYFYSTSTSGAIGLTQLMPDTALGTCPDLFRDKWQAYQPIQNLECGARYFAAQLKACKGDEVCALASYNQGPVLTEYFNGQPVTAESIKYVPAVQRYAVFYSLFIQKERGPQSPPFGWSQVKSLLSAFIALWLLLETVLLSGLRQTRQTMRPHPVVHRSFPPDPLSGILPLGRLIPNQDVHKAAASSRPLQAPRHIRTALSPDPLR